MSDTLERDFSDAMDRIILAESQGYGELSERLERVEREFLLRAGVDQQVQVEIRRRVAERRLILSCERDVDVETSQAAYARLDELGYSHLHRRATIVGIYAGKLRRCGETAEAAGLLQRLITDLEASLDETEDSLLRQDLDFSIAAHNVLTSDEAPSSS